MSLRKVHSLGATLGNLLKKNGNGAIVVLSHGTIVVGAENCSSTP